MAKETERRGGSADDYVSIKRHMRSVDTDPVPAVLRAAFRQEPKTWNTLVAPDSTKHVVLVAPSGSGKTTELKRLAARLRAQGRLAAYATAKGLAEKGLPAGGDEREDEEAIAVWQRSGLHLILVVDGIDELPLVQKSFAPLYRSIRRAATVPGQSCQLVLASRNGGWVRDFSSRLRRDSPPNASFREAEEVTVSARVC
jgi:hypothetical protein